MNEMKLHLLYPQLFNSQQRTGNMISGYICCVICVFWLWDRRFMWWDEWMHRMCVCVRACLLVQKALYFSWPAQHD